MSEEFIDDGALEIKKKKKRRGKPQNRNQQKAKAAQLNIQTTTSAKYPFLSNLNLDLGVEGKVSRLLDSIVSGSTQVYSTPLLKDDNLDEILVLVDNIFKDKHELINETLKDIELTQRNKIGPRSIALPWKDRRESTLSYFGEGPDISLDSSVKYFNHMGSLQPISKETAIEKLKNSTNSGLPYFTKKSLIKDKLIEEWDYLSSRNDPCVLFTRTQESKKTRGVWGYPVINSAIEMRFYSPLLEYQKKLSWRSAINSPDLVAKRITNLMITSKLQNYTMVSVDFSAYDASVKYNLQKYSFDYIKKLYGSMYHSEIDEIFHKFNSIGIITPEGIYEGKHGVPSGSTFTNEIDSIAQYLVAMNSGLLDNLSMQIQGDDGVYSIKDDKIDDFISFFNKCGLKLNADKSVISKDHCVYLQNLYHKDYINEEGIINGIYPIYRALNKILYQERFTDFKSAGMTGADYFTIRTISILENCKNHPLFEEFVKIIIKLDDKNSLIVNQDVINKYSKLMNDNTSIGAIVNQYGDKLNGFSKFKTVEIINKLRFSKVT